MTSLRQLRRQKKTSSSSSRSKRPTKKPTSQKPKQPFSLAKYPSLVFLMPVLGWFLYLVPASRRAPSAKLSSSAFASYVLTGLLMSTAYLVGILLCRRIIMSSGLLPVFCAFILVLLYSLAAARRPMKTLQFALSVIAITAAIEQNFLLSHFVLASLSYLSITLATSSAATTEPLGASDKT